MRLDLNVQTALMRLLFLLSIVMSYRAIAGSGLFFNVLATGPSANVSISLCLNGRGPISCQNYTVSALELDINTTIANHSYPSAGIRINTPGYALEGCEPISNGYCLFSVSNNSPANISLYNSQTTLSTSIATLALSVNCPPLTAGCAYTNSALTGNARQISIRNNGGVAATNLSIVPSGFPSGTSISASTCGALLAPTQSCIITITPGSNATSDCTTGIAPTSGMITVTADDAIGSQVSVLVLSYACIYQGGYVYSIDDTTPNTASIGGKVTATSDQASAVVWSSDSVSIWGIDDSSTPATPSPNSLSFDPATLYPGQVNCNGATDGACNTNNIYVYYSTIASPVPALSAYAVGLCKDTISGYSDWYLPAICEMGPDSGSSICTSPPLVALEQNMVDNLPILLDSCVGSMCLSGDYWSSTELFGNPSDISWTQCFASGGSSEQCLDDKNIVLSVRCSRPFS